MILRNRLGRIEDWVDRKPDWEEWFAWKPVTMGYTTKAFLCKIERKRVIGRLWNHPDYRVKHYEYRWKEPK